MARLTRKQLVKYTVQVQADALIADVSDRQMARPYEGLPYNVYLSGVVDGLLAYGDEALAHEVARQCGIIIPK